jgi:hypothetical protein
MRGLLLLSQMTEAAGVAPRQMAAPAAAEKINLKVLPAPNEGAFPVYGKYRKVPARLGSWQDVWDKRRGEDWLPPPAPRRAEQRLVLDVRRTKMSGAVVRLCSFHRRESLSGRLWHRQSPELIRIGKLESRTETILHSNPDTPMCCYSAACICYALCARCQAKGEIPATFVKVLVKCDWSQKPNCREISDIDLSRLSKLAFAKSIRASIIH